MPRLGAKERARLPDSAFAYIDSQGRRRLPINDASHVRNALSRFNQVAFEDDAARDRARIRLLNAAKKFGIVPIGFVSSQLQPERNLPRGQFELHAAGQPGSPAPAFDELRAIPGISKVRPVATRGDPGSVI